jgi:hypothetical protein
VWLLLLRFQLTTEHIKSHLQKTRFHHDRSVQEVYLPRPSVVQPVVIETVVQFIELYRNVLAQSHENETTSIEYAAPKVDPASRHKTLLQQL